MGTRQATITGMAGPIVAPPYPNSLQCVPTAVGSTAVGCTVGGSAAGPVSAAAPVTSDGKKSKSLLKLLPYNCTGSLETFLVKFDQMAKYLEWNEVDKFHHLCASLEGTAGHVLWGLKDDATAGTVIDLLRTRFAPLVIQIWENPKQVSNGIRDEFQAQGKVIVNEISPKFVVNYNYLTSLIISRLIGAVRIASK